MRMEHLDEIIKKGNLDADAYGLAVTFAERLVDNPAFQHRVRLLARALEHCPRLTGDDVRLILGDQVEAVA
jgi:hypothetical protein